MATKRGGLGINLDSLIPTTLTVNEEVVATQNEIPLDQISPNPRQPRTVFDEDALNELISSIKIFSDMSKYFNIYNILNWILRLFS